MATKIIPTHGLYIYSSSPATITLNDKPTLIDGDYSTEFGSNAGWSSASDNIGLDFGTAKSPSFFKLWYSNSGDVAGGTADIYVSNDNVNWTKVGNTIAVGGNILPVGGGVSACTLTPTATASGRYWKFYTPTGLSVFGEALYITEFEGYESGPTTETITITSDAIIAAQETATITSDANISAWVDPTIFTYEEVTTTSANIATNYNAFDLKLKHVCNHTLKSGQYTLNTCPRCLGTGYYFDIKYNEAGKLLKVDIVDKLEQTLEKFVLTEANDFHPEVAINLQQWLGEAPISEIKTFIKFELSKSLITLMETQRGVPNLSNDAQIASIDSIEVFDDPSNPDKLNYTVTITTIAGSLKEFAGTIMFK